MTDDPRYWSESGLLRELDELLPSIAFGPHVNLAHFLHDVREQMRRAETPLITTFAAREFVMRERWNKGCRCPVCEQRVQCWRRNLTTEMGYALVNVVKKWEQEQRPVRSAELRGLRGGDYSKLRYWDLVVFESESDEGEGDEGRVGGGMTPTEKGLAFVRRRISVTKYVWVYNNKPLRYEGDLISIDQLPGFDYDSIWGGKAP